MSNVRKKRGLPETDAPGGGGPGIDSLRATPAQLLLIVDPSGILSEFHSFGSDDLLDAVRPRVGKSVRGVFEGDAGRAFHGLFQQALATASSLEEHLWIEGLQPPRHLLVCASPRRDSKGTIRSVAFLLSDVPDTPSPLQSEHNLHRLLFENSRDAAVVTSPNGRHLMVNQAWIDLVGYSQAEALAGLSHAMYADPRDREPFVRELRSKGVVRNRRLRVRRKDGSEFLAQCSSWVCRDEAGKIVAYHGVMRDVTAENRAEEALRESEAKYRYLFENSRDAISIGTPEGTLLDVNQAYLDLAGYTKEELEKLTTRDLYVTPSDRDSYQKKMEEEGAVCGFEARVRTKEGKHRDVVITASVRRDKEGRICEFQSINHDVTEQKKAEAALRESEAKYRNLFENSRDAIAIGKPDGTLLEANGAWFELMGFTQEELATFQWRKSYVNPADRAEFRNQLEKFGAVRDYELRFRTACGRECDTLVSSIVRRDERGEVIEYQSITRDVTEKKRAEAALRESELRYRSLFEQSREACVVTTPEGRILEANPAWLHLMGYTRQEAMELDARKLYADPTERDRYRREIARTGWIHKPEIRYRRKDGTQFLGDRISWVLRDEEGKIVGYQGVIRDVTVPRRAEEALRESEAKYRNLFENSRDAIIIGTPDGKVLDVNQAWHDLMGYTPEELPGLNSRDVYVTPSDRNAYREQMEKTGTIRNFETRSWTKDGKVRDVICSSSVRRDQAGRIIEYQSIQHDVTEIKQAEAALRKAALRESENRYRSLFEQSREGICITSLKGKVVDANQAWLEMMGYTHEEAQGLDSRVWFTDKLEYPKFLADVNEKGWIHVDGFRFTRKDGSTGWAEFTAALRRDNRGRPKEIQAVVRDVTIQRLLELENRRQRDRIEQFGRAAAMGELAAVLAHEINQPLAAITNCAQASRREVQGQSSVPDALRDDLELIASQALRAGTVLRRFRNLVTQRPLQRTVVDVNEIVERTMAHLTSNTELRGAKLRVQLEADPAIVLVDEVLIQQVLINLVQNAIEAMGANPAKERIVVIRACTKGEHAEVRVRDRGEAVEPERIKSLFLPYVSTKPDGLGVGLSICKSIIERHGGRIWATRNRIKGMSFCFFLPLWTEGNGHDE